MTNLSSPGMFIPFFLDKFIPAVIILFIFVISGIIAQKIISGLGAKSRIHEVFSFVGRAVKFALYGVGLMSAARGLGADLSAIFAGLGITGLILGFALQNTLSNLVAGVLILTSRPFKKGDSIAVAGSEGIVREIGLRYTILESEHKKVLVPNSVLTSNAITILRDGSR